MKTYESLKAVRMNAGRLPLKLDLTVKKVMKTYESLKTRMMNER
jgi:hypothetical protein